MLLAVIIGASALNVALSCSDFYMNFTNFKLSARTLDLGSDKNWTITSWPRTTIKEVPDVLTGITWPAKYGTIGLTANWLGDNHFGFPLFFGDSMNEKGLSCSLLTLVDSKYQSKDDTKTNVFAGVFCQYVSQTYDNVLDLQSALPSIAIWGPDALAQHFVVRDSMGNSLVIEMVNGQQQVYLDKNDGKTGFGIMTNEPTFDWHLGNVAHYEWKRTLARQAVATPGNFYPEERFMRVHMVKSGMQAQGLMTTTTDYQTAFSLTTQVLNTITVPQGDQYGTDSGEASGEGNADHSVFGIVRDHADPAIYWRDSMNPSFRRLRVKDIDLSVGARRKSMKLETGPFFTDLAANMI